MPRLPNSHPNDHSSRPPKPRLRPPFFCPVPLRRRSKGWSPERQCAFLAQLFLTGSVARAAHIVGMSRESAHRLRRRSDAISFAEAWDHILNKCVSPLRGERIGDWRKVTDEALVWRVEIGLWQPVIYRRRMCGIRKKPCNSALLRLLRRLDRRLAKAEESGPA